MCRQRTFRASVAFASSPIPTPQDLGYSNGRSPLTGNPPHRAVRKHVVWHELLAEDWEKAVDFYVKLFGWQKAETKAGDFGTYQMLSANGQPISGIRSKPPAIRAPFWLYYFQVGDLDAATGRLAAAGGQILDEPFELSGGNWTVPCADPQGANFALEGKRRRSPSAISRVHAVEGRRDAATRHWRGDREFGRRRTQARDLSWKHPTLIGAQEQIVRLAPRYGTRFRSFSRTGRY